MFSDKASKGVDKGLDFAMFPEKNKSLVYTKLVEDDKGDELVVQALPFENINDVIVPLGISSVSYPTINYGSKHYENFICVFRR